jgi:hypothetical protein
MAQSLWLAVGVRESVALPISPAKVGCPADLLSTGRLLQAASSGPRGRGPSRAGQCRRMPTVERCPGGAQSSAPDIFPDRDDAVPPMRPCGRGTVLRARSCGSSSRPGESPSSTIEKIGRANARWEGHSPLRPIFSRTARTRSLPTSRMGSAASDLGSPREGRSPLRPIFLRTARTRSLPWDLVGGAQSSAPAIFHDRGDAVPPRPGGARKGTRPSGVVAGPAEVPGVCLCLLLNAAGCLRFGDCLGGARSFVPEFSYEPRERVRPRSCRIPHPRDPYRPPEPHMGHRRLLGRREGRWRVRACPISRHAAGRNSVRSRRQPGTEGQGALTSTITAQEVGGRVRSDEPWRRLCVRAFPHEPLSGVTSPRLHGRVPGMRRIIRRRTCPLCRRMTGCIVEPFSSPSYSARRQGIRHAHA